MGARPMMPGSTPAPGLGGMPNPYATSPEKKSPKKSESGPSSQLPPALPPASGSGDASLEWSKAVLERQCRALPYDVRQSVLSILGSCYATSAAALKEQEAAQRELHHLRKNHKTQALEIALLYKRCDKFHEADRAKSERIDQLVDEEVHNREHQNKAARSIERLAKTNRVLIAAFEALGKPDITSRPKSTASEMVPSRNSHRRRGSMGGNGSGNGALPNLGDGSSSPSSPSLASTPSQARPAQFSRQGSGTVHASSLGEEEGDDFFEGSGDGTKETDASQNGKIRASLLRMARDYYKMVKNIDLLNTEVEVLGSNLKYSEKRNRQLQLELDEMRETVSLSSQDSVVGGGGDIHIRPETPEGDAKGKAKRPPSKALEDVDRRLADLIAQRALDPVDGIKQMRLMLQHLAAAPSSLSQTDVATHLTCRHVCKLFEVDAIVVYVLQPGGEMLRKYSSRTTGYVVVPVGQGRASVAETVIQHGRQTKINSHKSRSKLEPSVDGCEGVHTRKLLCAPLMDASNSRTVGCMQFINKFQNFKFSETDDLYTMMFCDLAGTSVASALLYERVWDRALTLTDVLQASTGLFSAMPDAMSITSSMPLDVDRVLLALEECARRALKCAKVKAFVSSGAVGLEEGSMVALEDDKDDVENKYLKRKHKAAALYTVFPDMPGIAGMVMRTARPYLMVNMASDQYHNPQSDMNCHSDHGACPVVSVPIVTLQGVTIAVLQMLPSARSPKLEARPSSVLTGSVLFEEAAKWLAFQLSFSLEHVLAHVGKPCHQPPSLPETLELMQHINPASLALKMATGGGSHLLPPPPLELEYVPPEGGDRVSLATPSAEAEGDANAASWSCDAAEAGGQGVSQPARGGAPLVPPPGAGARREAEVDFFEVIPTANPMQAEQITVLHAEIKRLKKTIGRMSTIDLMAMKSAVGSGGNKKSPLPSTICESIDDFGSNMGLFFSDDDLDGTNKADLEKYKLENAELVEDNAYLRNEMEGLKELYASAVKLSSNTETKGDQREAELNLAARLREDIKLELKSEQDIALTKVREDMKVEQDILLTRELAECNATYMARGKEQDKASAVQAKAYGELAARVDTLTARLQEGGEAAAALTAELQAERGRAAAAETKAAEALAHAHAQTHAPAPAGNHAPAGPPPASAGSRPDTKAKPPASRGSASGGSPRGHLDDPPPAAPSEDMVPTSPRLGGWARFVDENHYPYYHNELSGETCWERPDGFPEHEDDYPHEHAEDAHTFSSLAHDAPGTYCLTGGDDGEAGLEEHGHGHGQGQGHEAEAEVRVGDWVQGHDDVSGMPYWRSDVTGESLWELPADAEASGHYRENASDINSGQASGGYHSPTHGSGHNGNGGSPAHYGVSASAGDYKIEL
jgi:hypothetical protein